MEPLVALSLAANIAQFIEFSSKIIHGANEIYHSASGTTQENEELESVVSSMRMVSLKLDPPSVGTPSDDERALRRLAADCRVLSDQLVELLQYSEPTKPASKRHSLVSAVKSAWTRRERMELETRLANCRSQLELQLNFMVKSDTTARLSSIGMSMEMQVAKLTVMHKHVEELSQGVQVTSISREAQDQMRTLLDHSQAQCEHLARSHILKSLADPDRSTRFDNVEQAHQETFLWLFSSETGTNISEQFGQGDCNTIGGELGDPGLREAGWRVIDWLSSGSGIFHVSGKLGSGKSTLMKFLFNHPGTRSELMKWAGEKRLVLANFFFWKPGSKFQNSLSGLFRSLLHDILESSPDLIPVVFEDTWHDLINCPWRAQTDLYLDEKDIRTALTKLLARKGTYVTHSFCFFIDGLDEYQETFQADYKHLVRVLKDWVTASGGGLKICVSSREYNVFQNAFPIEQRVRLQDLTRTDMERYTRDMLEDMENDEEKDRLVQEIVHRADGIFLWVALVVKVLREYIEDDQDFSTFESVLNCLPDELEALFEYLLASVPKPARKRAYQIFALIPEFAEYSFQLCLVGAIFLEDYEKDPLFAMTPAFKYSPSDRSALEEKAQKRVNGYCKGLVEIKTDDFAKFIAFTHRSVPEFLGKERTRGEMASHLIGFDLKDIVPQLILAQLRISKPPKEFHERTVWPRPFASLIRADVETSEPFPYLSALESAIVEKFGKLPNRAFEVGEIVMQHESVRVATNSNMEFFTVVSPFYLSAALGKLEYVLWRIGLDPTFVDDEHNRAFLTACLRAAAPHNSEAKDLLERLAQGGHKEDVLERGGCPANPDGWDLDISKSGVVIAKYQL